MASRLDRAGAGHRFDPASPVVVFVVFLTVAAWAASIVWMGGMDLGPGTPLHGFPVFVGSWVLMLSAMMLPSEVVYLSVYRTLLANNPEAVHARQARRGRQLAFAGGYMIAWTLYGVAAFVLDAAVRSAALPFLAWDKAGPMVAGLVLAGAGAFQVSSLKEVCLTHCRTPMSFFARYWRPGVTGSLQMGLRHGVSCVGCCWALMAVMFAVGVMNLAWMAVLTAFMMAEKIAPFSRRLRLASAIVLIGLGAWMIAFPETFPFLQDPSNFEGSGLSHDRHH